MNNPQLEALIDAGLTFSEAVAVFAARQPAELVAYRDAVQVVDGELEVDDDAIVSESDGGAYVMTWSWVDAGDLT